MRFFDDIVLSTEDFHRLTIIIFRLLQFADIAIDIGNIIEHSASGGVAIFSLHPQASLKREQRIVVVAKPPQGAALVFQLLGDRRAILAVFGDLQRAFEVAKRFWNAFLSIGEHAASPDPLVAPRIVATVYKLCRRTSECVAGIFEMASLDMRIGKCVQRVGRC
ncbi:MAG: hypothetical protein V4673_19230 [Pseudomonadota bacterium]